MLELASGRCPDLVVWVEEDVEVAGEGGGTDGFSLEESDALSVAGALLAALEGLGLETAGEEALFTGADGVGGVSEEGTGGGLG